VFFFFFFELLSKTFVILKRTEQDTIKYEHRSSRRVHCYSCKILIKLEFSQQIFKKYSNIKFYENPSSGSPVFLRQEMDVHDGTNRLFSQFCEHT